MQRSALCTSRRELSNAYLLAKFRFDTAEPCKVCRIPVPNGSYNPTVSHHVTVAHMVESRGLLHLESLSALANLATHALFCKAGEIQSYNL